MKLSYHAGVGELIWAMTTCHPDLAFHSVKLSQSKSCPHKIHYHSLLCTHKYLFSTKYDGIYFWWTSPHKELLEGPLPPIQSNKQDLLLDKRPDHYANVAYAYADLDWDTCVKTCCLLAVHVFVWLVAQWPTKLNFSRLLQVLPLRWNICWRITPAT